MQKNHAQTLSTPSKKKTKIENNLSMLQSFSTSTWSYLLMEGAARVYAVESVVMAHAMP